VTFFTEIYTAGLIDLQIARERLVNTALHPVGRQRAVGLLETLDNRTIKHSHETRNAVDAPDPQADVDQRRRSQRRSQDQPVPHEPPSPGPSIS
jgi:hypothetical protein